MIKRKSIFDNPHRKTDKKPRINYPSHGVIAINCVRFAIKKKIKKKIVCGIIS